MPHHSRMAPGAFSALALVAMHWTIGALSPNAFARGGETGFPNFSLESSTRGVNYVVQGVPQANGLYGFGVGCIDLDPDGDDDLVCIGKFSGQVGVYANNGSGQFTDASLASGIANLAGASAVASADLDGDRLPELIFTQVNGPVRVYRNQGSLRFVAHTLDAAFGTASVAKAVSLSDIDRDGDLDFFLANYPLNNSPSPAERNRLLRNDGSSLVDLAPSLGMNGTARTFLGVFTDIDVDGDADLYVSNDRGHIGPFFAANQLWRNDGNGVFTDVSAASGANVALYSMGVACGDFDDNGAPDLLMTNLASAEPPVFGINPLLLGQGDGTFARGETIWQVEDYHTGWGALFLDLDHNGYLDLYVNHQGSANALWTNAGTPPATLVPGAAGAVGVTSLWNYSTSCADLDRDGDLDLVALGLGSNLLLYMNQAGNAQPSVRIRLEGIGRNTSAIGGRVEVRTGKRTQFREIHAGGVGYMGQNTLEAHFGLGGLSAASSATVRFPDGAVRQLSMVPAGAYLVVHPSLLGDGNYDHAITAADRPICQSCITAALPPRAGSPCARFDYDGNMQLDAADLALFDADLAHARADLDDDGVVGSRDIAILLNQWGAGGPADLDLNGAVGPEDVALLLQSWG